jgi:hypothetical protein
MLLRTLSVARPATATLGTCMKLLDESAQVRIGLPSILWVGGVHKLVAVMVHLHSAERQIIVLLVSATQPPWLRRSVQRYLLTTMAQRLGHPNEFVQKLINAPDVGLIEEFAILGKHFLHHREIYVPENGNEP